jgi:hypothetical protein
MGHDPVIGPVNGPVNKKADSDRNTLGKPRGGVPVTNARTRTPRPPTAQRSGPPTTGGTNPPASRPAAGATSPAKRRATSPAKKGSKDTIPIPVMKPKITRSGSGG